MTGVGALTRRYENALQIVRGDIIDGFIAEQRSVNTTLFELRSTLTGEDPGAY
ncbi:hypothetical protein ACFWIA_27860 [Streptomyces sp. NPDC127068]|uniref:hypothetical protein n=1 Tax=Streptomyces sp. NPDC127068 TaxID=3347127 RepID=UPI003649E815